MTDLTALESREFLVRLASDAPVPGGGGGAALAGALAAALSSMVGNLTVGKEKFAAHEAEVKQLLEQAEDVRVQLLQLVNEDAAVFAKFMECYKLPKATDEEKAARSRAIQAAAKQAAKVPFAIAEASLKVLQIAERLVVIGNPGVITDGAVSALLARAALRSAVYNVLINLKLTKDDAYNAALLTKLQQMQEEAERLENAALAATDAELA